MAILLLMWIFNQEKNNNSRGTANASAVVSKSSTCFFNGASPFRARKESRIFKHPQEPRLSQGERRDSNRIRPW